MNKLPVLFILNKSGSKFRFIQCFLQSRLLVSFFILIVFIVNLSFAQTITSAASGNWHAPTTWTGGIIPGPASDVQILNTHTVTVDAPAECASLSFPEMYASINVSAGGILQTGFIRLSSITNQDTYCELTGDGVIICAGNLIIGTPVSPAAGSLRTSFVSTSVNTLIITGNILFTGSQQGQRFNNPGFFIEGGNVLLEGQVTFANVPGASLAAVYFILDQGILLLNNEFPWNNHPNFLRAGGWGDQNNNGATYIINLNGVNTTVIYGRNGNQTINRESSTTGNFVILDYNNLILSGSGIKTLPASAIANVYETLSMQGSAVMANKSPVFHDYSTLEYKGSVAQTTTDYEFPQTGGPQYLIIDNPLGVSLNSDKTLKTSDINLLLLNSGTLNNSSFNVSLLSGSAVYRTGGSVSASPTYNTEVNIYYSDHTASVVSGPEIPEASSLIKNITVQNLNGVEFSNNITLCQKLIIGSNAIANVLPGKGITISDELSNNGTFALKSDNSGTATLLCTNMTGSGTFNMEQYLTGSGGSTPDGRMWYLGSPMDNASSGVFDASGNNKLWSYSEPSFSYTEITNNTTGLNPMEGYVVRLGATETVTFTGGKFNTGTFTNNSLTRTGTSHEKRGYHLVANPYPAHLNWAMADTSNVLSTIWYRTANLSSTMVFDTYNSESDVGTNNNQKGAVTKFIPPMQAVWVKVPTDGLTGSVSYNDTMTSHNNSNLLKNTSNNNTLRVAIDNNMNSDESVIVFNPAAGIGITKWDSEKMMNSSSSVPQMWTQEAQTKLVINAHTEITDGLMIPLYMTLQEAGQFTLKFDLSEFDTQLSDVWLMDIQLGSMHACSNGDYVFTSGIVNDNNRFVLVFNDIITENSEFSPETPFTAYAYDNILYIHAPADALLEIFNLNGQCIVSQQIYEGLNTINIEQGVFIIRATSKDHIFSKKIALF